ncbi:MAG: hypothetical protein ACLS36_08235 [Streptococcus sp.]
MFEGKDVFVQMLHSYTGFANDKIYKSLTIDNISFLGKYYESWNELQTFSAENVFATNQKYYHSPIDNLDSITQSWNERKFSDMFEFYKEFSILICPTIKSRRITNFNYIM